MRTVTIKCRHGEILIDEDDYERVSKYTWSSYKSGNNFYVLTRPPRGSHTKRGCVLLHRFITNAQKGQHVDHANHNGLDNRKSNLRPCAPWQNAFNRLVAARGITFDERHVSTPWRAMIGHGRSILLGYFATEAEAIAAYRGAARVIAGEFFSEPQEPEQTIEELVETAEPVHD